MVALEIMPGVTLDSRRALWLRDSRVLVVADLHWGYAASHQACGNLLPMWGDAELAVQLRGLIEDYRPTEMLWLGDSLHTLAGRMPAETFLRETSVVTTILPGNHDRSWTGRAKTDAGGRDVALPDTITRGDFFFHHGHVERATPPGKVEIIGHYHPALAWYDGAGGRLKVPGLVASSRRLILPAFSPWAAGAVWNEALAEDETLFAIGAKRIFAVSRTLLLKSRVSA